MSLANLLLIQSRFSTFGLRNNDGEKRLKYEAEIYDFCKKIYQIKSAVFETQSNWRNVLGIRAETPLIKKNRPGKYDDYIWIVYMDA